MNPDRVLTINGYFDEPILGVAELQGVPHIYEAEFDRTKDEYGGRYFLSPIDPELLALVLEASAIWLRWNAAYLKKEVSLASHPALPHERKRHEELTEAIGDPLTTDPANRKYFKAKFSNSPPDAEWAGTLVQWHPQ